MKLKNSTVGIFLEWMKFIKNSQSFSNWPIFDIYVICDGENAFQHDWECSRCAISIQNKIFKIFQG